MARLWTVSGILALGLICGENSVHSQTVPGQREQDRDSGVAAAADGSVEAQDENLVATNVQIAAAEGVGILHRLFNPHRSSGVRLASRLAVQRAAGVATVSSILRESRSRDSDILIEPPPIELDEDISLDDIDRLASLRMVRAARTSEFPPVGAIAIVQPGDQKLIHCSATLVSPSVVLTAAHCIHSGEYAFPVTNMRFVLGDDANSATARSVAVIGGITHPLYDRHPTHPKNDLAVLYLRDAITDVLPAELVPSPVPQTYRADLTFVGYGFSSMEGGGSGLGTKRSAVINDVRALDPTRFLYVMSGTGMAGTCGGDSGGPGFERSPDGQFRLIAITSFGDGACQRFGVNTRVDAYLEWLRPLMAIAPSSVGAPPTH